MKIKFNLNKIIKYLVLSDLIFYTGWGLLSPIFAIFIVDLITNGTALVVGIAAGISLITRSVLRIPLGMYADKTQKNAYYMMFWGLLFSALVPFGYIFARLPSHIYILQAVLGAGLAMSTSGWTCLFSRHLDRGKESTEWGVDAVAVGIGPGIAGIVGGFAVTYFSFNLVFSAVGIIGLIGVMLLLAIEKDILRNRNLLSPLIARRSFKEYLDHNHRIS